MTTIVGDRRLILALAVIIVVVLAAFVAAAPVDAYILVALATSVALTGLPSVGYRSRSSVEPASPRSPPLSR